MKKISLVILANEQKNDHELWIKACKEYQNFVEFRVMDLTSDSWLDDVHKEPFHYLLTKPAGFTAPFKQLYDERVMILGKELNYPLFPSLDEILIYENKRYLSYWLKAHKIPHPETHVFYNLQEALLFFSKCHYPQVAKMNIGASGRGINILKNQNQASKYAKQIFTKGKTSKTGPNLKKGKIFNRALNKIKHPSQLFQRLSIYTNIAGDRQRGFMLVQTFIPHSYEWRVVRIGNSFFAHKKLKKGQMASGSLLKNYDNPPLSVLNFVKNITDQYAFYSVAFDIFEIPNNRYFVNEIQCIFGQSDPYQMLVNGMPGKYIFRNNEWIFSKGDFNRNESFNLRLEFVIDRMKFRN